MEPASSGSSSLGVRHTLLAAPALLVPQALPPKRVQLGEPQGSSAPSELPHSLCAWERGHRSEMGDAPHPSASLQQGNCDVKPRKELGCSKTRQGGS